MGGYDDGGYHGYQAGGGGGGVGVQPPGLFLLCVLYSFFGLCSSLFMCSRFTALCMVMQESTARGVENRCMFIHKAA